jgi:hypothetical protein
MSHDRDPDEIVTVKQFRAAYQLVRTAMGKTRIPGRGRHAGYDLHNADEDPAAAWAGTEAVVSLIRRKWK